MPEQLLTILKFCLLALLYLVFLRVLRAQWVQVRDTAAATSGSGGRRAAAPGAAAAPKGRPARAKGAARTVVVTSPPPLAGRSGDIDAGVVIGRAADCTISIDDAFVSQRHTRVYRRDGTAYVEDLGSTNGTYVDRRRVAGPTVVRRGDRIHVGNAVLEVR